MLYQCPDLTKVWQKSERNQWDNTLVINSNSSIYISYMRVIPSLSHPPYLTFD